MGQYTLSFHAGHNASACIGDETGLLYAIQEERLSREKNYWGVPEQSLKACLDFVGATPDGVESIVYGSEQVLCRRHTREDVLKAYQRQGTMLGRLRQQIAMPLVLGLQKSYGQTKLKPHLEKLGFENSSAIHYGHHLTHAATAYYGLRENPDDDYLVLTCDGAGDLLAATVRTMGKGESQVLAETSWENSLGALYSWVTYALGFVPLEHEYKLMGMAPYASDKAASETAELFHSYLGLDSTGLCFKKRTFQRTNDLCQRIFSDLKGKRFDYICAGLQRFTEEILSQWIKSAIAATGVRKVLAAGGVFMNVKANQVISEMEEVESFEAFPSCGDETLPIGALFLRLKDRFGDANVPPIKHFYLGDDLEEQATEASLKQTGFQVEKPDNIAEAVAEILAQGHPIARCAGRMEFGARALGNRSILADPSRQDVVRVINQMVKKRDFWMPFAPMVLDRRQHDYFQNPKNLRSPYMMMAFPSSDNFNDYIAAVHNADLTCRAQILSQQQNPEMYDILEAFESKTGRGVILNTSFNLHGFPIVRTGADALEVLKNSGLNYLQVGSWIVSKKN